MHTHNTAKTYTKCLCELMSFINGVHYDATASFTCNELMAITAIQAAVYLNKKAYGTPSPSPDDCPQHMRGAVSLAYHKKAISQFMPLRIMAWDDINLHGDPTHSTAINDVITRVKNTSWDRRGFLARSGGHWNGRSFIHCCGLSVIFTPLSTCGIIWLLYSACNGKLLVVLMMSWSLGREPCCSTLASQLHWV